MKKYLEISVNISCFCLIHKCFLRKVRYYIILFSVGEMQLDVLLCLNILISSELKETLPVHDICLTKVNVTSLLACKYHDETGRHLMLLRPHGWFRKRSLLVAWLCILTYIQSLSAVGRGVPAGPLTALIAGQIKRQCSSPS